ncbi:MAG: GNAT family N-acetyltransferase [Pseudomonadota bacterium]
MTNDKTMTGDVTIRPTEPADLPALKAVIDAADLFPSHMLDGMAAPALDGEDRDAIWLTCDMAEPVGLAYCAPEPMTDGTWNLYLIAVRPEGQGRGCGTALVDWLQGVMQANGARMLIVETSGAAAFKAAQAFYLARGFEREATVRDFYGAGDDKVIYRRLIQPS